MSASGKGIGFIVVDTAFHQLSRLALRRSIEQMEPESVLVFSDDLWGWPSGADLVEIDVLESKDDYNQMMLEVIPFFVKTDYCIVLQYDGFVVNGGRWDPSFLNYDYIGAPWPNYPFHRVGNGGFSLRSRRLLQALYLYAQYRRLGEPEDVFVGRTIRPLLESRHNLRFAEEHLAMTFSFEAPGLVASTFGFHGVFNLPLAYRGQIEELINAAPDLLISSRHKELAFGARYLDEPERSWFLMELTKRSVQSKIGGS